MSIKSRIAARPELAALVAARDVNSLAAALNAAPEMERAQRFITARAVMAGCANGVEILSALEGARANSGAIHWALTFLGQEAGLDIGDPFTQGMIDSLVLGGVLTHDQGEQLKNLALAPRLVSALEVANEMYNPDGSEK